MLSALTLSNPSFVVHLTQQENSQISIEINQDGKRTFNSARGQLNSQLCGFSELGDDMKKASLAGQVQDLAGIIYSNLEGGLLEYINRANFNH